MTVSIWKLDKLVLPSSVEFSLVTQSRWGAEIQSMVEYPAGHVHPMFRANREQRPVLEFTTPQLKTLLQNIGVGGASLGSTASYFKAATATGNAARNATSHKKITIASSLAHWTSISLPHNGRAEANVVLTAVYDGSNDPFVYAGSQALSGNLATDEYFGLGPVAINGTNLPGVQSIEISSGVKLIQAGESSSLWDTFVGIEQTAPTITIRTFEMVNWGALLDIEGVALNGSDGLVFWARRYAAGGSRIANGTSSHIKFVGLNGSAIPVDSNGQDSGPITDTLKIELVSASDSVAPLTGAVDQAIS